jgi:hypothetical protein
LTQATNIDEVIARMEQINQDLPPTDGVACFNRMYLDVTKSVESQLTEGFFANPRFMEQLDVVFANIYFDAVDATGDVPLAWDPLFSARTNPRIFPIQFALAGMNAHINHDLPMAVVQTCNRLATSPNEGTNHADFQKVDSLLDAVVQAERESFESGETLVIDQHAAAVLNLIGHWSVNSARDVAWNTSEILWLCRGDSLVENFLTQGLARSVAMASRMLLVTP